MKNIKFLILTIFTTLLTFSLISLFSNKVEAYISERYYNRVFEVRDDHLKVIESKELTIVSPGWFIPANSIEVFSIINLDTTNKLGVSKLQRSIDTLRVYDSLGNNLSYELKPLDSGTINVEVKIATEVKYLDRYKIFVEYESLMLYLKTGNILDIYIPGFSQNYIFESDSNKEVATSRVIVNKKYGDINFVSLNSIQTSDSENNFIEYSQSDLIGETGWIQIGLTQYYTFNIEQEYSATSTLPFLFNTYKIIIPRDIVSGKVTQKVFFTSISHIPYFIEKDIDGNLIAYFRIPSNQSGEIYVRGYASLEFNKDFDITNSGTLDDLKTLDSNLLQRSIGNAKYWESTNIEIQNVAKEIRGEETNIYNIVLKTYKYVVDKIDYSEVKRFGANERTGALATLRGGAAVCMEYSDLFIALLRSLGIPARASFGYGYSALDNESLENGTINHQWAEVYFPSLNTWMPVDTTWGENGNEVIGGDLNHFYSYVATISPNEPSSLEINYLGNLGDDLESLTSVMPIDKSILEEGGKSEEDILMEYKKPSNLNEEVEKLGFTLNIIWQNLNDNYRIVVLSIPLILIVIGLIVLIKKKFFKEKFSTFDKNIAKIYR